MDNEELVISENWVEWVHISEGLSHCPICLALDKCYFEEETVPEQPQHYGCHCTLKKLDKLIVYLIVEATSDIRKFNEYIFHPDPARNHGKKVLFESWGYDIIDSDWLQKEFERQAKQKYLNGEYELGKLDKHGQRIDVEIELPRKDKDGIVTFISGWMIESNGEIRLTTPYGDKW